MQLDLLHISNTDTLKPIYFAYFYSLMKKLLWGNSLDSKKVFTLQSWWVPNIKILAEIYLKDFHVNKHFH
jgi:hypothetical protein